MESHLALIYGNPKEVYKWRSYPVIVKETTKRRDSIGGFAQPIRRLFTTLILKLKLSHSTIWFRTKK